LAQDWENSFELESELYSLIAEWDLPVFTVRSLTSYQDDDLSTVIDNDRNDLATLRNQGNFILPSIYDLDTYRQKTITQELNLISAEPLFGRLDWVAGVFYLDTEVDLVIREYIDLNADGTYGPGTVTVEEVLDFGGEVGFISDSKPERESISVYGQGTWNLTDSLRLVAGLRYTEDEVYSEVTNFFGRAGTAILETRSEKLTGRGVVEFDLNDTTMVYASYTRGFKPGGSNLTYGREDAVAPIVVLPTYADETVEAWEAGIKTDFADNRVRVNAAAFYYDYKNLQYQATDPEVFEGGVGNLPGSEIYGAEVELLGFITESLTLDARLAWLETEISESHLALDNVRSDDATNALLSQCGFNIFCDDIQRARAAAVTDVEGNELAKTPNFTADVMLRYRGRLGGWGDFEASAQYIYRDGFQHRIFNNPRTDDVPSYNVVNLMLTLAPDARPWHIDLMGMNLADEDGINARFTDVFGVGSTGDELIAPRQYMVRFGMEF
ncbi:MAG: TonB-dependent receptor, partial [Gammaproteobacteria bacterium]|nr:TonB-dependent receptor [Gammaproteobacteria bacterium]